MRLPKAFEVELVLLSQLSLGALTRGGTRQPGTSSRHRSLMMLTLPPFGANMDGLELPVEGSNLPLMLLLLMVELRLWCSENLCLRDIGPESTKANVTESQQLTLGQGGGIIMSISPFFFRANG